MTPLELYLALTRAQTVGEVETTLLDFESSNEREAKWVALGGRENNQGTVGSSSDPGRSIVERLTNGVDAVLEAEYEAHQGRPPCRTPKEAANAWLGVPDGGLSDMTPVERRTLAQRVLLKLMPGDGRERRVVEIRDRGIGLAPEEMPRTILSLNETNKMQKHYLVGVYGQGGSSTYAVSAYTFIASRRGDQPIVGFTVIRYHEPPPGDDDKIGHYVYLTFNDRVLGAALPTEQFSTGTVVKHFGYDLSNYGSPLGPTSVYGLLNQALFDPPMPVWLDNRIHDYRRVIKGSRNALNGAVDEGDERRGGPALAHRVRLYTTSLGEFGRIGIEYWVLERPTRENKKPSAAFVNPSKPIVLTLHGQNHAEFSQSLIKKNADLPYLTLRLICHVDCNRLTPMAKRVLFVTNREDARRGVVRDLIHDEVVQALASDEELRRLNTEAMERGMRERDEEAVQEMRREVARLLRLHGVDLAEAIGAEPANQDTGGEQPTRRRRLPRPAQPLPLNEPPTYIRFVWDEDIPVPFYPGQRRYVRIETDAHSHYHSPENPIASRINIIGPANGAVILCGSTPLQGGRLRSIFEGATNATEGTDGRIRVELIRAGLPVLADEREVRIVPPPPARPTARRVYAAAVQASPGRRTRRRTLDHIELAG